MSNRIRVSEQSVKLCVILQRGQGLGPSVLSSTVVKQCVQQYCAQQ